MPSHSRHRGSTVREPSSRQAAPLGVRGGCGSTQPSSASDRSALVWLHRRQAATTLSQVCVPPRLRGTTWSMLVAELPQYTQVWPSRVKTARRDRGTDAGYGTRTKRVSRTTTGTGRLTVSACTTSGAESTDSAFAARTSTMARRLETTHNGSYVALSSRLAPVAPGEGTGRSAWTGSRRGPGWPADDDPGAWRDTDHLRTPR